MKKLGLFFGLLLLCNQGIMAQAGVLKAITKIPASFTLDVGISTLKTPLDIRLDAVNSRSVNAYLMFDLGIKKAGFSLNPGLGISSQNYGLENQVLVGYGEFSHFEDNYDLKKSKFNTTYFDVPLELRWASNVGRKAFRMAVGAKAGFLLSSHSKTVDENRVKNKVKNNIDFNPIQTNIYGRIGYNWYSIFASYGTHNSIFENQTNIRLPMMFGISFATYR